jgi:putative peptidoglycan lipid II flippase
VKALSTPESSRLLRESATGSLGALVALGAGLLLDLTLGILLGAGANTDALFTALRIPLGVAVFFPPTVIQVLVPAISKWLESNEVRRTNVHTSATFLATFLLTAGLAVAGILSAHWLIRAIAPGLGPATQKLSTDLARVAFLIIPPLATSQVFLAFRHAHRRHGLASAVQAIPGLTVVATLLALPGKAGVQLAVTAYVVGGLLQLVASWLLACKSGFAFVPGRLLTPETRMVGTRSLRPLAASAVQLASRIVELMVASFLAPGSITILTYANRLVSAIGGTLLFKPVMTAFIAPMSRLHAAGNTDALKTMLRDGLRLMLFISVSLTALVAVGGAPFTAGLFSAGDFTADQARFLGITVAVYAASLPTAALQRMLLGLTFARLDTATYLRNTIYGAVANFLLLGAAMAFWRTPTLLMVPIAYALAQIVNVWHAAVSVREYLGDTLADLRGVVGRLALVVAAAVIFMIAIRLWLAPDLSAEPATLIVGGLAASLVGTITLGAGALLVTPADVRRVIRISR